jgi:GNAT superfamily N-acetyltransferase
MTIATRLAEMRDLPFLDGLQKKHSKQLGFFPKAQMEGYVRNQWVLIAEDAATKQPLGYCASRDRYLKRDELGVIYQLCVAPGHQRGLIGATLIKSVFERAAYGCRLFCCWCAQDLEANYFWESLGFVPIAFRAGSGKKRRLHIFWQRRVDRAHSVTPSPGHSVTPAPYWYPFQTSSGALRADRLVFPIPPGVRWQDVKPIEVPVVRAEGRGQKDEGKAKKLPSPRRSPDSALIPHPSSLPNMVAIIVGGRVKYVPKPGAKVEPEKVEKPKRVRAPKEKETLTFDPRFLKQNRELRDRYLERVNSEPLLLAGEGGSTTSPARSRLPSPVTPRPLPLRQTPRLLPAA